MKKTDAAREALIERLAKEVTETFEPWQIHLAPHLQMAAITAHNDHVSREEFLIFADTMWRGCDPMDLPPKKRRK